MENMNYLINNGVDINKSLELFGNMQTYNETIGEFLTGIQDKLHKLEFYKNQKDMATYAIYAHALKADAKNFGFTQLAETAYNQELKSKEEDLFYITEHWFDLEKEVQRAQNIVKGYLSGEKKATEKPLNPSELYDQKTILVVDDSNIIRNFVKRIFSETYQVGTAKDGLEAINIIRANQQNRNIVAILLDLNMPKMDGFAVLDYMKENDLFKNIPVSIISGDCAKETIDRAYQYQIIDMLEKPFNETDVKRVVERTLCYEEVI